MSQQEWKSYVREMENRTAGRKVEFFSKRGRLGYVLQLRTGYHTIMVDTVSGEYFRGSEKAKEPPDQETVDLIHSLRKKVMDEPLFQFGSVRMARQVWCYVDGFPTWRDYIDGMFDFAYRNGTCVRGFRAGSVIQAQEWDRAVMLDTVGPCVMGGDVVDRPSQETWDYLVARLDRDGEWVDRPLF